MYKHKDTDMPKRILIAEDDKDIRDALKDILQMEGYSVDAVEDGKQAIELIDHKSKAYDLVILDLLMPMNGHDTSMVLKARGCRSPILMISGAPGMLLQQYPLEYVEAFLPKPLELDRFLPVVETLSLRLLANAVQPYKQLHDSRQMVFKKAS